MNWYIVLCFYGIACVWAVSIIEAKTLIEKDVLESDWSQIESKYSDIQVEAKNCDGKVINSDTRSIALKHRRKDCETNFDNKLQTESVLEVLSKDDLFPVNNPKKKDLNTKISNQDKLNLRSTNSKSMKTGSSDETASESIIAVDQKDIKVVESNGIIKNINSPSSPISDSLEIDLVPEETDANSTESLGHFNGLSILDTRSFIFNPNARPQEKFQQCTTPRNETGQCRYLQHCMVPNIISSLNQFMGYVCIIKQRYIGVCCPLLPANVVHVPNNGQMNNENVNVEDGGSEMNSTSECGVGTNTRIVGGLKTDPKAWPWMVALIEKAKKRFFCGGALINNRYVLTAAHCTFGIRNNEITARLGEYDFQDESKLHTDYTVIKIKRHGLYNRRTLRNDIALLELGKPVVFTEFIQTICLPDVEKSYLGETATLAGWGNIKGSLFGDGKTSDILQEASFPVITNQECARIHGMAMSESLICTNSKPSDKGACNGDSGGPLMLLDKNNRWKIIGIVSWGRRGCNPEYPTVYTRVSHFLEWIKKHSMI